MDDNPIRRFQDTTRALVIVCGTFSDEQFAELPATEDLRMVVNVLTECCWVKRDNITVSSASPTCAEGRKLLSEFAKLPHMVSENSCLSRDADVHKGAIICVHLNARFVRQREQMVPCSCRLEK